MNVPDAITMQIQNQNWEWRDSFNKPFNLRAVWAQSGHFILRSVIDLKISRHHFNRLNAEKKTSRATQSHLHLPALEAIKLCSVILLTANIRTSYSAVAGLKLLGGPNLHFYCSTLVFNIYFLEFAKLLGGPGPPRPLPTLRHCHMCVLRIRKWLRKPSAQ